MRHTRRRTLGTLERLEARLVLNGAPIGGNCPPSLDFSGLPDQQVRVGQTLAFNIFDAGAVYADEDGGDTPRNLLLDPDPEDTPAGATITRAGDFRWSPTIDQLGGDRMVVIAIDDGSPALAAASFFQVQVLTGNDAPSFTLGGDPVTSDEDAGPQSIMGFADAISPGGADEGAQQVSFVVQANSNPDLFSELPAISPAGTLTFTPADNAYGTAEITVVLMDDGGTANGGTDTSAAQTFTIMVDAVNDRPQVVVPAAVSVDEDMSLTITGVSISDVDGADPTGSNLAEVTLSVEHGVITLFDSTGLTFVTGDGSEDALIVARGTLVDLNAAIASLTYRPASDFQGADTLQVDADDLGNTGAGGSLVGTGSLLIEVQAVNDAPELEVPGPQSVLAGDTLFLAGITVFDRDADEGTGMLEVTLSAVNGQVATGGQMGGSLTLTGTQAELNALLATLTYESTAPFIGIDTITIDVNDLGNFGSGGPLMDQATIEVEVLDVTNTAPDLMPIVVSEPLMPGVRFEVLVEATDAENDDLVFQLNAGSPEAATITAQGDGTALIVWTPTLDDIGEHTFGVLVVDNGEPPLADVEFFDVTVSPTFVVTTAADEVNSDAAFSLREVLLAANDLPGTQTVTFSPDLDGSVLELSLGEIPITESVTIDGTGRHAGITIDGGGRSRLFHASAATGLIAFRDLHLRGGRTSGSGGAILSEGAASLLIEGTWVTNNSASGNGGGIAAAGPIQVTASTISNNTADGSGGGMLADGTLTMLNSTVSGNRADQGGGLFAVGNAMVWHSTLTENVATTGGGLAGEALLELSHVIVAGNTGQDIAAGAGAISATYSLIGDNGGTDLSASPTADANGNLIGSLAGGGVINPRLGPLASNGGRTPTHALAIGSPAVDAGDAVLAAGPAGDQRGGAARRIADGGTGRGAIVDMGAYERQSVAELSVVVDLALDEEDGDYSPGDVSLREAVAAANVLEGMQAIEFAAILSGQTIVLSGGEIVVTESLIVSAEGLAASPTIDAAGASRIFHVTSSTADFTVAGLTLAGGATEAAGKAGSGAAVLFRSAGALILDASTLRGNVTRGQGASGGAISSHGSTIIFNSTLSANETLGAAAHGGAVFMAQADPVLQISNSTISGNASVGDGGAIRSLGDVGIYNSTITLNRTTSVMTYGGAIRGGSNHAAAMARVTISNSIVAGNTRRAASGDVASDLLWPNGDLVVTNSLIGTRSGTNLVASASADAQGNFIGGNGALSVINPLLDPLADNGGPTLTHALQAGSLAIDAGNADGLLMDQRGMARTIDDPAVVNGVLSDGTDMGSYERQLATAATRGRTQQVKEVDLAWAEWDQGPGSLGDASGE